MKMPQNITGPNGPFASVSNSTGQWVATITWTDLQGTSTAGQQVFGQVGYNTDPNNLNNGVTDNGQNYSDNPPTTHSIQITGLTAGTTYYFNVSTLDSNGNTLAQSATSSFVTAVQQVTGAPTATSSSPTAETMTWQANVAGIGKVLLGTSATSMTTAFTDGVNSFSHTVQATPLQPGTQYYFVAQNLDNNGNVLAQSAMTNFNTPPANVQVNLTQPLANPWIVGPGTPSTLSVLVVAATGGKPQAGITVNFKIVLHLGGNGQIIGTGSAVSDATGHASVQFIGKAPEIATIEATSANSNSHLLIPVVIR
jgi:hypothetical protein